MKNSMMTRAELIALISNLKTNNQSFTSTVKARIDNKDLETETTSVSRLQYIKDSFAEIARGQATADALVQAVTSINGVTVSPPRISLVARHEIDDYIEKVLKAKRNGYMICWKLDDGFYKYDPIADKLVRSDNEN